MLVYSIWFISRFKQNILRFRCRKQENERFFFSFVTKTTLTEMFRCITRRSITQVQA